MRVDLLRGSHLVVLVPQLQLVALLQRLRGPLPALLQRAPLVHQLLDAVVEGLLVVYQLYRKWKKKNVMMKPVAQETQNSEVRMHTVMS